MAKLLYKSEKIKDLLVITPEIFHDFRGENLETYNKAGYTRLLSENGIYIDFVADTFSFSNKNVLRGFHGDTKIWKLVQCIKGRIFLAVIDVRTTSPTHHNVETFNLNDKTRIQVLIPAECVNAHLCVSDECIFGYKQSHDYVEQKDQIHVKWNDPRYTVRWPISGNPILSERDS